MSFESSTFKLTENGENMLKRSWFVGGHFQEHLEYKCEDLGNNESKLFPLGLFLFFSFSCVVVLVEILPGEEQVFFFLKLDDLSGRFPPCTLIRDQLTSVSALVCSVFSWQTWKGSRADGRTDGWSSVEIRLVFLLWKETWCFYYSKYETDVLNRCFVFVLAKRFLFVFWLVFPTNTWIS